MVAVYLNGLLKKKRSERIQLKKSVCNPKAGEAGGVGGWLQLS